MTKPHDPAFPVPNEVESSVNGLTSVARKCLGINKREYIATRTLQSLIKATDKSVDAVAVKNAVAYADALLAELSQ